MFLQRNKERKDRISWKQIKIWARFFEKPILCPKCLTLFSSPVSLPCPNCGSMNPYLIVHLIRESDKRYVREIQRLEK